MGTLTSACRPPRAEGRLQGRPQDGREVRHGARRVQSLASARRRGRRRRRRRRGGAFPAAHDDVACLQDVGLDHGLHRGGVGRALDDDAHQVEEASARAVACFTSPGTSPGPPLAACAVAPAIPASSASTAFVAVASVDAASSASGGGGLAPLVAGGRFEGRFEEDSRAANHGAGRGFGAFAVWPFRSSHQPRLHEGNTPAPLRSAGLSGSPLGRCTPSGRPLVPPERLERLERRRRRRRKANPRQRAGAARHKRGADGLVGFVAAPVAEVKLAGGLPDEGAAFTSASPGAFFSGFRRPAGHVHID
mmetsp:Transcript_40584/g.91207  ORF Transcript_40584/g.91207 Transcript_40584/m.91207 type:complete len:306 (-) Transcript_40584:724-1641(-)